MNKTNATAKGGLTLTDANFDKLCDLVKQKNFGEERISLQCKSLTRSFLFTQFLSNFAATNAYKYAKMGLINIEQGHIFLNEEIKNKEIERNLVALWAQKTRIIKNVLKNRKKSITNPNSCVCQIECVCIMCQNVCSSNSVGQRKQV